MFRLAHFFVFTIVFCGSSLFAGEIADLTVNFSPNGGCEKQIISAIDDAENSILVATYSFSSKPIAQALYDAAKRGVVIRVVMDRRQPKAHYSMCDKLVLGGLTVRIDNKYSTMHQKTLIIDGDTVIAGSYNFTASAEHRNSECLLTIKSKPIAARFEKNWLRLWEESRPHLCGPKLDTLKNSPVIMPDCQNGNCPAMPSTNPSTQRFRRIRRW